MKIYVAHRTDVEPSTRLASGSANTIKEKMKASVKHEDDDEYDEAEFTVVCHDFKPNLDNVCQAIVDVTELDAEWGKDYKVTSAGHVREVKS